MLFQNTVESFPDFQPEPEDQRLPRT